MIHNQISYVKLSTKKTAHGRHWISRPMRIVAPILFSALFHQEIADYGQVLIKETEFWWLSVLIKENHQKIAGYGPLQRSHQGDHQWVMVQVMDLISVLIMETIMRLQVMDLFRVLIKDTEFWYTNERPGSDHVIWGPMRGLEKNTRRTFGENMKTIDFCSHPMKILNNK